MPPVRRVALAALVALLAPSLGAGLASLPRLFEEPVREGIAGQPPARVEVDPKPRPAIRDPHGEPQPTGAPVPSDLSIAIVPTPTGARVELRQPGHVLAAIPYFSTDLTTAKRDVVTLDFASAGKDGQPFIHRIAFESTPVSSLATSRGIAYLTEERGRIVATEIVMTEPVVAFDRLEEPTFDCAAHTRMRGGFTVLCLARAADVLAKNLTDRAPTRGVVVAKADGQTFVRFDLDLDQGTEATGGMSFTAAGSAVEMRADASWVPGSEATLLLAASSRPQA